MASYSFKQMFRSNNYLLPSLTTFDERCTCLVHNLMKITMSKTGISV